MITFDQATSTSQTLAQDTTATTKTFLNSMMNWGYKYILAELNRPNTEKSVTATTRAPSNPLVDSDHVYQMPPGALWPKSVVITVGSQKYPLTEEESQEMYDYRARVNTSGIPSIYFVRPRFGVGGAEILLDPIPAAAGYTINLVYESSDPDLSAVQVDNTTNAATLTFTQGSQTITSNNSIFTAAMIGRYLNIPDGDGEWYRIVDAPSGTSLTLENYYQGTAGTTTLWTINQLFNLPEEMQILPVYYALWHYFASKKDTSGKIGEYKTLFDEGLQAGKDRWATKTRGNVIRSKNYSQMFSYPMYFPPGGISN
jgi:hypothetical protein